MIETMFEKEKEQLSVIINSKSIIQNISYKLSKDKNSIDFFENLITNIKNYWNMDNNVTKERMHNYYFLNDLKEMYKILNFLNQSLRSVDLTKNKTAEEIAKCCSVFPDHIGERIIISLSYLPIINLFYEKIKYLNYVSSYVDLDKKTMGETVLEYQKDRLFNKDSLFGNKFPDDEDFIDYAMKNKYIDELKKEFNDTRSSELDEGINHLLPLYKSDNLRESTLLIGMTYWDERTKVSSENSEKFKEAILALTMSFDKDKAEKIEKLETMFVSEIKSQLNKDIVYIEIKEENKQSFIEIDPGDTSNKKESNQFFMEIDCGEILSEEEIFSIQKIFILKKDYELTNVNLHSSVDCQYIFKCKIEV